MQAAHDMTKYLQLHSIKKEERRKKRDNKRTRLTYVVANRNSAVYVYDLINSTTVDQRLVTVASLTTVPYKGTLMSNSVTKQILPERQTRQDFIGKLLISRYSTTRHIKNLSPEPNTNIR